VADAGALPVVLGAAEDDVGGGDPLVVAAADDDVAGPPESVVAAPVGDAESVDVAPVDVVAVPPTGSPVTMPLELSVDSTCCCTAATCAAISAGVASAPRAGSASSRASAACSLFRSSADGCSDTVTTIWSAIAVVMHAGQSTFSAPAALIGAIVSL
jgi:hypothetical protein